tara:strand:+ start:574 stop:1542 length:969 start_codon:yes stop_codon:yes gene_type:complete
MRKLFLCLLAGCLLGADSFAEGSDKVVARGLGFTVKQSELDSAYRFFVLSQAVSGWDVPALMESYFMKQALDEIVLDKIASTRATAGDRGQAYIQATDGYNDLRLRYVSEAPFVLKIQSMGMTTNAYRLHLQKKALTQQVLKRELKPKALVRETDILEFYNENVELWKIPESADIQQIIFFKVDVSSGRRLNPDERAAKQIAAAKVFAKARAGVGFAQLAREYSEDMASKNNGGKMRVIRGLADESLSEKVFSMRVNKVEMLDSEYGFHIIRVSKKNPASMKKLSQASSEIRQHLLMRNYIKVFPEYVSQLRQQAYVKLMHQ